MGAAIRGAGTVSSDIAGIDTAGSDAAGADISLPDSAAADSAAADSADTDAEGAMTVVFCTYQSLEVIEQAQRAVPGGAVSASFDLVICDEAHRTTGVHETDAGSHFTLIHDRRRILADKRLYMTATPRIYTDRVRAQAREHSRDFDVFSMDDETVFGPEFYRMSFGEAVEGEHLSDYKVLVIAVSELHVSSLLGNEVLNLHDDEAAAPRGGGVLSELSSPRRLSGSRPRRPSSSWVAGTPSRILPLAARTVVSPGRSLRRVPASGGPLHSPTRSSLRCWSSSTGTA